MKTKWILQTNIFKEKAVDKMIECFKRQDIQYDLVQIIPFSDELPKGITDYDGPVIAYGTTTLLRNITKSKKFFPGMWYDENTFKPSVWGNKHAGWLNWRGRIIPMYMIADAFKHHKQGFIRPDDDLKTFTSGVITRDEFMKWYKYIEEGKIENLTTSTKALICGVIPIEAEWRFVIINRDVITGSMYKRYNQLYTSGEKIDIPDGAIKLANIIAKDSWQVSSAYTLDICKIPNEYNDVFKFVEINCLNSSGFYECDVMSIIYNANILAEREWEKRNNQVN